MSAYLGRPSLTPRTFTERLDGDGKARLFLRRYPVLQVISLVRRAEHFEYGQSHPWRKHIVRTAVIRRNLYARLSCARSAVPTIVTAHFAIDLPTLCVATVFIVVAGGTLLLSG